MRGEYLPTERVALVAWYLAEGRTLTEGQMQGLLGVSKQAVSKMMRKIARVRPIVKMRGEWMSQREAERRA